MSPASPWPPVAVAAAASQEGLAEAIAELRRRLAAGETFAAPPRQPHRYAVVAADPAEAVAALDSDSGRVFRSGPDGVTARRAAFMFPGQGAPALGMAGELRARLPAFAEIVDRCCEQVSRAGIDLRPLLDQPAGDVDGEAHVVPTKLAQPALFVVEYALARLLGSWGIEPAAMIGHSVGEYVAAAVSGVLEVDDCIDVLTYRGLLMQETEAGMMLVVLAPREKVEPLLPAGVDIAAVNAPRVCVITGPVEAVTAAESRLEANAIRTLPLGTSHAFHSSLMDPVLEPLRRRLQSVRLNEPRVPYVSNLTGDWITPEDVRDPSYWLRHLRGPVLFADGLSMLLDVEDLVVLEVGPGSTLAGLARRHPSGRRTVVASCLPRPGEEEALQMLAAVAQAWCGGADVDWRAVARAGETP